VCPDGEVQITAPAVTLVRYPLLNGASLYGIAQEWNREGLKTVKGYQWNGTSVRQMLMRPRNAGLAVYDVHSHRRIQDAIIEGAEVTWPAIVSRETYDAVLALLADPARHTGKKRARVHLLSGLAVCGLCGRKMGTVTRATKTGGKRHVYQCKNLGCMRVVRDVTKTDRVVVDIITARLARPDAAQIFAKKSVDIKALGAEANRIRSLIRAAEVDYESGEIDSRLLKGRKERLQPKLKAIEEQLLGATTSHKLDGLIGKSDAAERFAALPLDRQRAVIDAVAVVTIEVSQHPGRFDPASIRIDWR
jgi:site-specific DNA recombinase